MELFTPTVTRTWSPPQVPIIPSSGDDRGSRARGAAARAGTTADVPAVCTPDVLLAEGPVGDESLQARARNATARRGENFRKSMINPQDFVPYHKKGGK